MSPIGLIAEQAQTLLPRLRPEARLGRRDTICIVVLLLTAFAIYALVWQSAPITTYDTPSYMRLAQDIRQWHLSQLHARTPGYPLIMVLTGSENKPTRALFYLQLGLQLSALGSMVWFLQSLGIGRKWVYTFLAVALLPLFIASSAYAETEAVCQFAVVGTYIALVRWLNGGERKAIVWFTLLATYAALVRPTYELLVVVVAGCACCLYALRLIMRPITVLLRDLALATGACAAILMSYAFLNYVHFNYFDLSYMGALALNHKTASFIEFLPEHFGPLREILVRHRDNLLLVPYDDHTGEDYIYRALPELRQLYAGDESRMLRDVKHASVYLILHKPISYIHDSVKAIASYWMPIEEPLVTGNSGLLRIGGVVVQWALIGIWLVQAIALTGVGAVWVSARLIGARATKLSNGTACLVVAHCLGMIFIVYTMVISCFFAIGQARYRVPADPIMIGTAIIGFTLWRRILSAFAAFAYAPEPCKP